MQGFESPSQLKVGEDGEIMSVETGRKGIVEKAIGINKAVDVGTVGIGLIIGAAPVVALGIVSFLASDYVDRQLKNK